MFKYRLGLSSLHRMHRSRQDFSLLAAGAARETDSRLGPDQVENNCIL